MQQTRLLLVDDEPAFVRGLTASLRHEGFAVDTCHHGSDVLLSLSPDSCWLLTLTASRQSLVVLDAESLDVVTDINLQGGNGAGLTWLPPNTEIHPRPVQP